MPSERFLRATALAAAGCALTTSVWAADGLQVTVKAGAGYSSNANRTPTNEVSSATATAGLEVLTTRSAGRLRYSLVGDVDYRKYLDNEIAGQAGGGIDGSLRYDVLPGHLVWTMRDSFRLVRQDLLLSQSPDNNQFVNDFSVGPDVSVRFGDQFEGRLEARYSRLDYQRVGSDSDRYGGRLLLLRRPSQRVEYGLGVSADNISYRGGVTNGQDYDRNEVFARASSDATRISLEGEVGFSQLKPNFAGQKDSSGLLLRFNASRRISPFSGLALRLSQEYSAGGSSPISLSSAGNVPIMDDTTLPLGQPALARVASLSYDLTRPRTQLVLVGRYSNERYEGVTVVNRRRSDFRADVARRLTPRSRIGVYGRYATESLTGTALDINEFVVGASWILQFGPRLGMSLDISHIDRSSDYKPGEYSEMSGSLQLRYTLSDANSAGFNPPYVAPVR